MSKYDKTIEISHEEEGSYHRREVEPVHSYSSKPVTTYHTERYLVEDSDSPRRSLVKSSMRPDYTSDEGDNFEEWTTSKRKVNHKTRQVETRVSRQLLVENGKVIADSGPQVTTRIKEDNRVEECEKEKTPKNKSRFQALENAPEGPEGACSGRVLGEKKEIQKVSREVREENMQYHDERFKELTGRDVHQKAIRAPHELITIHDDKHHSSESAPRGKMVHYSNKGKVYKDTDEILEVAKLAIDGSITKEVKRTNKHEEFSEDEKPDEKGEAEELRHKPIVQRSSRRHADYVNDYDDLRTPDVSDNDEREEYDSRGRLASSGAAASRHRASKVGSGRGRHDDDDQAFPRYDLDPLLNSLHDDDFKPATTNGRDYSTAPARHHVKEHSLERQRYRAAESSDEEPGARARARGQHHSPAATSGHHVEIPEEYRVNKQRLMASKSGHHSPARSHSRSSQHKSSHARNQRKGDAAVQAHLTDEELERQSVGSSLSGGARTHAKTTQHLERQSTPNASRRYYYGNAATANSKAPTTKGQSGSKRRNSVTSTSSASSMSSLDERRARQRQQGTRSRDSGFKSPHSAARTETPLSEHKRQEHQIYSVSSKARKSHDDRAQATSPTPTTGSAGQRSVKTTTTTLSAGLADRPMSPRGAGAKERAGSRSGDKLNHFQARRDEHHDDEDDFSEHEHARSSQMAPGSERSFDTISVSSLNGPNATKIKVPYRHVIEIQTTGGHSKRSQGERRSASSGHDKSDSRREQQRASTVSSVAVEKASSEMSFQEDIERLSNRLANISKQGDHSEPAGKQFNYKTLMANIGPAPDQSNQVISAYNARLEQNSPFQSTANSQPAEAPPAQDQELEQHDFSPSEYYVKYRATPALVDESALLTGKKIYSDHDEDRMSQLSSSCCSLHSSRTYKIRTIAPGEEQKGASAPERNQSEDGSVEFDENGNSKRAAAWIYDPRDGSTTAIIPPKRPETPKVDTKAEELAQSRGGRSYYLEILDNGQNKRDTALAPRRQQSGSMNSLYSRWNSQGTLNANANSPLSTANSNMGAPTFKYRPLTPAKTPAKSLHRSTKQLNSVIAQLEQNRERIEQQQKQQQRRQLPFGGPLSSLGDKAKSSSCLLTVTKPSKYSIYGGFRKPDETNKPVPRLSYSRAIGPRSQRVDSLPKSTPSRYLKMR